MSDGRAAMMTWATGALIGASAILGMVNAHADDVKPLKIETYFETSTDYLDDAIPGAYAPAGSYVKAFYELTNTSGHVLTGVKVTNDHGTDVRCPSIDRLEAKETKVCTSREFVPTRAGERFSITGRVWVDGDHRVDGVASDVAYLTAQAPIMAGKSSVSASMTPSPSSSADAPVGSQRSVALWVIALAAPFFIFGIGRTFRRPTPP